MLMWWEEHSGQGVQGTTAPLSLMISEGVVHSWVNRLETVRVSHWPITWSMYLPCTVAQEQAQHCASNIVSNSHIYHFNSIDLPIPKIWLLKIWPWKSKVKVLGEFKVQSHNLGPRSYRLTSFCFHVNPASFSYKRAFFKLTFKIPGESHSSRSHSRYNILSTHIPFVPCWSALPFLRYSYFKNWPWKFKVKFMCEVKVPSHNVSLTFYRLTTL